MPLALQAHLLPLSCTDHSSASASQIDWARLARRFSYHISRRLGLILAWTLLFEELPHTVLSVP
jgi:hypothetical protein